jgi:hypothetical protein
MSFANENEMSVSKKMLGKTQKTKKKTGRIEASWATITYRNGICTGGDFPRSSS